MATYDLEEQEQLATLKAWWDRWGNLASWVVAGLAMLAVGWQAWNYYRGSQAQMASQIYMVLEKAAADSIAARERNDDAKAREFAKRVRDAQGELLAKYSGTTYAGLGALLAARVQLQAGDMENARAQLAWVVANGAPEELRLVGRLHLAYLLIESKTYDDARKYVDDVPEGPYAVRFLDLKGDLAALQNRPADARAAYRSALDKLIAEQKSDDTLQQSRATGFRDMLQIKLDALGEGA
ncbi:MAG: tetratricopeptide repeat protein [Rhodocyclaceae bacterium]|nr:tetratricopeptide repeat protein [Rhodocyclaceae bacterium]